MSEEKGEISVEGVRALLVGLEAVVEDRGVVERVVEGGAEAVFAGGGGCVLSGCEPAAATGEAAGEAAQGGADREGRGGFCGDGDTASCGRRRFLRRRTVTRRRGFEQSEVEDPDFRELVGADALLHLQRGLHAGAPFLRPAVSDLCGVELSGKRTETADLRGRVALLTGGRVKIVLPGGDQAVAGRGASLIVTTRFPRDAAARYAEEPDFAEWGERLEVFGLDLRHTPSVEAFCQHVVETRGAVGFYYQQRLSDGAAAAGFLPAHDGPGDGGCWRSWRTGRSRCWVATRGLRGYHLLPEGTGESAEVLAGLTHAAELSQAPLLPEEKMEAQSHLFPGGQAGPGFAAGGPAGAELVAADAGGGEFGGAVGDAAGERGGAVCIECAVEGIDDADAGAGQAHRQRVGGGGAVLPEVQDDAAPAHEHGEGGVEHDDADVGGGSTMRTGST